MLQDIVLLLWGLLILTSAMLRLIWLPSALSWKKSAIRCANILPSLLACRVTQLVSLTTVSYIWLLVDLIWNLQHQSCLHQALSLRLTRELRFSKIHLLPLDWTHQSHFLSTEVILALLKLICSPALSVWPRRTLWIPLRTLTSTLMIPSSSQWSNLLTVQLLPSLLWLHFYFYISFVSVLSNVWINSRRQSLSIVHLSLLALSLLILFQLDESNLTRSSTFFILTWTSYLFVNVLSL